MTPNRLDIIAAELWWGNKCGHAALAAVLGVPMREARRLMPPAKDHLVTQSMWKAALDRAERKWSDIGVECPSPGAYGLVCLAFSGGPSHAVAIRNDGLKITAFDNSSARWLTLRTWESIILPIHKLTTLSRRCWIDSVIEVEAKRE